MLLMLLFSHNPVQNRNPMSVVEMGFLSSKTNAWKLLEFVLRCKKSLQKWLEISIYIIMCTLPYKLGIIIKQCILLQSSHDFVTKDAVIHKNLFFQ